jgi:hypothetical protein
VEIRPCPDILTRFYLAAYYSQWAGGTIGEQISIWEWTGKEARAQCIKPYSVSIDAPGQIKLKGNLLIIGLKANMKTFMSCGSCIEPEATLTLKITSTGVENLGLIFKHPEYKYFDELFYRIQKRQDIQSMVAANVIRKLRQSIRSYKKEIASADETGKENGDDCFLGMFLDMAISQSSSNEIVDFNMDGLGILKFTLSLRNGAFYALSVQIPE